MLSPGFEADKVPVPTSKSGTFINVLPTGILLLQTTAQTSYCAFLIYSTRAKPVIINPYVEQSVLDQNRISRASMPFFGFIRHVDSYLPQNTHWHPLEFNHTEDILVPTKLLSPEYFGHWCLQNLGERLHYLEDNDQHGDGPPVVIKDFGAANARYFVPVPSV